MARRLHQGFDHGEFSASLLATRSMCMITYNSNPNIRSLFYGWEQVEWDLTYSMNNGHKSYEEAQKNRKELLLTNYEKRSINTLEAFSSKLLCQTND